MLSSNTSETRLSPSGLIKALSQRAFLVYSLVYVIAAVVLAGLSRGRLGRQYVFVDVGLCALFGMSSDQWAGWRVLCLVSVRITECLFLSYLPRWIYRLGDQGSIDAAHDGVDKNLHGMDHVSYPCGTQNSNLPAKLLKVINMDTAHFEQVLIGTGVGQIRYLNRALMRFDAKVRTTLLSDNIIC